MVLALTLIMIYNETNESTNDGAFSFLTTIGLENSAPANLIAGFFGGLTVGLYTILRAVVSSRKGKTDPTEKNHTTRAVFAGLFIALLFGIFGGIVAVYFNGVSGSFVAGLTALGLIASIVGDSLQGHGEKDGT